MGILIKGKQVADKITEQLKSDVEILNKKNIYPKIKIIRVGENPSDLAYERGALKRMDKCSVLAEVVELPAHVSQKDFVDKLKEINDDKSTHGILVFRPVPKELDEKVIKYIISPEKDVDCFSPINVAKVMDGDETGFAPCTAAAVVEIIKYYSPDIKGKNVVVLGRSMVVGKPVSMLLLKENATVTICHSKTKDLNEIVSKADIVVVAVGKAEMIDESFIKDNAIIIDVGINVDEEGKMVGDVDTNACIDKCSMITPVPGGVGSVTTSILAKHVVRACKDQMS